MIEQQILNTIIQINLTRPAEQGDLLSLVNNDKKALLIHLNRLYSAGLITTTIKPRISHRKEDFGQVLDFAHIVATLVQ